MDKSSAVMVAPVAEVDITGPGVHSHGCASDEQVMPLMRGREQQVVSADEAWAEASQVVNVCHRYYSNSVRYHLYQ